MNMQRGEAIVTETEWTVRFGRALRLKNPLGVSFKPVVIWNSYETPSLQQNVLFLSDPKALQHILQTRSYSFSKPAERKPILGRLFGSGILMAEGELYSKNQSDYLLISISLVEGDDYKRQRRVMLPAFGTGESRNLVPIFSHYASQAWCYNRPLFVLLIKAFPIDDGQME